MSGVFGVVGRPDARTNSQLVHMGRVMTHKSWFQVDTWVDTDHEGGLGRVFIQLFNSEDQPVHSDDRRVHLVFSGELYDTDSVRRELTRSGTVIRSSTDSDLMMALYQHDAFESLSRLEGMFVVAVWDEERHLLTIANDKSGLYPLLYSHFDGRLVFAPEVKGILCHPGFKRQLDLTALAEYVRFQVLLGEKTFFSGLSLMSAGSILRFDSRRDVVTVETYWDLSKVPVIERVTLAEAATEAGRLLSRAVQRRSQGRCQIGTFLSGGLDSRVLLGFLQQQHSSVTTITYGAPGSRDVVYARRLASKVGSRHHFFPLLDGTWVMDVALEHLELTEGFHSWIHAHGLSVLPRVRELVQVTLSGLRGEELGWVDPLLYEAPDDLAFANRLFHTLVNTATWPGLTEAEAHTLFSGTQAVELRSRPFESLQVELRPHAHWPYQRQAARLELEIGRRLYQNFALFHRAYTEQRYPFHDGDYTDFVYALPTEMLRGRVLREAVILKYTPEVAGIPECKSGLPIFRSHWRRQWASMQLRARRYIRSEMRGPQVLDPELYVDYEKWLRRELRVWGERILFGGTLEALGYFNMSAVRSLWERHQLGLEVNSIGKLAPLMTYAMMCERFLFDAPSVDPGPPVNPTV